MERAKDEKHDEIDKTHADSTQFVTPIGVEANDNDDDDNGGGASLLFDAISRGCAVVATQISFKRPDLSGEHRILVRLSRGMKIQHEPAAARTTTTTTTETAAAEEEDRDCLLLG